MDREQAQVAYLLRRVKCLPAYLKFQRQYFISKVINNMVTIIGESYNDGNLKFL